MNRTIFATLFALSSLYSQAKSADVKGVVVGTDGKPIPFVNVVLLSTDSTFVEGATSGDDGSFNIATTASDGILRVTSVGYEPLFVNIKDYSGVVTLKEDARTLSEVVVKEWRPKTKLTGNSMITSIKGSALEKSGTAKEMLAKIPGMIQKGDDLEVLGKGTPIYYINGRKVNDTDELKRLRSEEIKEVEVVTNPGAQYDATVSAVVRIKTMRREGVGFGFDVNLSNQQDLRHGYADPGATLNLRYRHKTVDVFGMVNYWKWDYAETALPEQKSYFLDGEQLRVIEQNSSFRNVWSGEGIDCNVGFNWQIAENHSVGARLERHDRFVVPMEYWQRTEMTQYLADGSDRTTETNTTSKQERDHVPYNWEGNAYYNGTVGKLGIDLNLDFLTNKTTEETPITEERNDATYNYATSNRTSNAMYAAKLVLSYPIWRGQVQAGMEATFVNRKNTYTMTGLALPNSDSEVQEKNIATFAQYACQIPAVGNLSVGLRYEHVGFDYTDKLSAANTMSRYTDDLFPSVSWANQWGAWQASLAYSVKTSRPSYWHLSEAVQYLNPYSLQQGDPKLRNATTYVVSANARWKFVNLYAAYEQRNNAITQWSYINDKQGVILIKHINLANPMRNLSAFLTASPTWGCFSPNWTVGMQKYFDKYTLADPRQATGERQVRYTKPIAYVNLNNAFRFKHSWLLECNAAVMTSGDVMNYRLLSTSFNLGFVVQKCWLRNDALCLRASVTDVLQRNRQNVEMDCGYYTLVQNSRPATHRFNVSLRYTFNAQKSKYKGTGAGQDAAGRMKK